MKKETGETGFTNLSPEQVSEQNQEAFDYLMELNGRRIHSRRISIEVTQEPDTNLIQVRISTLPRNIAEDPGIVADLTDERYWISRENGLEEVKLQGHAYLRSGLSYLLDNDHGIAKTEYQRRLSDTIDEVDLLPAGNKSAKTAARLIADTVKDYIETQSE